ncbi:MAG: hypothetical protein WBG90_14990 [Saonia sp.]
MLHIYSKEQKHVLLKTYYQLLHLEQAIEIIRKNSTAHTQVSILGKLDSRYSDNNEISVQQKEQLNRYWKESLGPLTDVGFFSNPEIGTVYIAGPLTPLFLSNVDGKKLGEITNGPYGILRGLGIHKDNVIDYIKTLEEGGYWLIIRGFEYELRNLEDSLRKVG